MRVAKQCHDLGVLIRPLNVDLEEYAKVIKSGPNWIGHTLDFLSNAAKTQGISGSQLTNLQISLAGAVYRIVLKNALITDESVTSRALQNISTYLTSLRFSPSDVNLMLGSFEETLQSAQHGRCNQ